MITIIEKTYTITVNQREFELLLDCVYGHKRNCEDLKYFPELEVIYDTLYEVTKS